MIEHFPKSGGRGEITLLLNELATWQAAEGGWLFTGWPLPNPDPILRAMGAALPTYRRMLYDAHVGGLARRRRAAVKSLEYRLEPGRAKTKTIKLLENAFARIDVSALVGGLWEATLFGFACAEILWEKHGDFVLPKAVLTKPQEWFSFDSRGVLLFMAMGSATGIPVPERKFLLARQDPSLKNPYGIADLARCFWPYTFKKGGLKFWLQFVEKYGSPKLVGKFDRNTSEKEQNDLLELLKACVQDAVMVIPNDNSVETLATDGSGLSGAAENYEAFLRFCRSEISIALLGQDQTTEADTNHASATAGLEVATDIRDADAAMIQAAIQPLLRWIVDLNISHEAEIPEFILYEQEDAVANVETDFKKAARDKAVAELRQYYTDEYLEETYHLPSGSLLERENVGEIAAASQQMNPQKHGEGEEQAPTFAEQGNSLVKEANAQIEVDAFNADLSPAFEDMLAPLIERMVKAGELSEKALAEAVAAEYPEMKLEETAEFLARARFVCRLWGYVNA